MVSILAHAQKLVYILLSLMPSQYQRENLEAMLGLFLEAQGHPIPQHSKGKSPSALSRFLNIRHWSTQQVIRVTRNHILKQILSFTPKGRRPMLQVIIDLTTLEKCGKFDSFKHLICVYNGKRGLHLIVLYLVVGRWRVPWSFRVWRGKGTTSPAQLGLKLVKTLPKSLTKYFQVMILVDTAFGTVDFLHGIRKLKYHAIAGLRYDRQLIDGRSVSDLYKRGQQVRLAGLKFPVSVSWCYLKRDGKFEKRFVLSTKPLKGSTISRWGKRRWLSCGLVQNRKTSFCVTPFWSGYSTWSLSLVGAIFYCLPFGALGIFID